MESKLMNTEKSAGGDHVDCGYIVKIALIQSGVSGLKTGLQERLVEAELLCLFQCIGSQSHRLIFPADLPVFVLIMIFELEQFLRDDHFAFHAEDSSDKHRLGKECVGPCEFGWGP